MPSGAYPIVFAANYISLVTLPIYEWMQTMNDKRPYTCTQKGHFDTFGDSGTYCP